jgi:hypothetical protein
MLGVEVEEYLKLQEQQELEVMGAVVLAVLVMEQMEFLQLQTLEAVVVEQEVIM